MLVPVIVWIVMELYQSRLSTLRFSPDQDISNSDFASLLCFATRCYFIHVNWPSVSSLLGKYKACRFPRAELNCVGLGLWPGLLGAALASG